MDLRSQWAWPDPLRYMIDSVRQLPLAWRVARYQTSAELSHTSLGLMWLVVAPLLLALPGVLIFGYLLEVDRGVAHYPLFATIGLVAFRQISRTWQRTVSSNRAIGLSNVPPGTSSAVGVMAYAGMESLAALFALTACTLWGMAVGAVTAWALLGVPIVVGVISVLSWAYGMLFAAIVNRWEDLAEAFPHGLRVLALGSGVWFLPQSFVEGRWFAPVFDWNPATTALELARAVALGHPLRETTLASTTLNVAVALTLGSVLLWRAESTNR